MAKKKHRARAPQKGVRNTKGASASAAGGETRRGAMIKARNWAIGFGAIGAGGWFGADYYTAMAAEHDLGRIGVGVPTVVQIHDPQCPTCAALMKQARAAMSRFSDEELQYVVANLRTEKGAALAARYGVGKITLLLFDRDGHMQEVLPGVRDSAALTASFRAHLQRNGRS